MSGSGVSVVGVQGPQDSPPLALQAPSRTEVLLFITTQISEKESCKKWRCNAIMTTPYYKERGSCSQQATTSHALSTTARDNAITLLASRLARSVDQEGPEMHVLTPQKVALALLDWRTEQLANYKKW